MFRGEFSQSIMPDSWPSGSRMQDTSCLILTIFDALFDRDARLPPTLIDGKPGETHRRCSVVFNVHDKGEGEVFEHRAAPRSGEKGQAVLIAPFFPKRSHVL